MNLWPVEHFHLSEVTFYKIDSLAILLFLKTFHYKND